MPGLTREPRPRDFDGRIAQLVEQLTLNQRVQGSSPCAPTIEHNDLAVILGMLPNKALRGVTML